ncbi:hypothetical protein O6H91_23G022700 [Diphasiastrum complanatum]|uniref:Uncharacterized protein n=1 Tax=Diphasiastrum complanatum TaxID=34168 RepID=A0ACC2A8Y0_DIPCM|nr:hypothetical protein O6H91_23G022700 [Diphasiastrum complanatum]
MSCCNGSSRFGFGVRFQSPDYKNPLASRCLLLGCSSNHWFTSLALALQEARAKAAGRLRRQIPNAFTKASIEGREALTPSCPGHHSIDSKKAQSGAYTRLSNGINFQCLSTFPKHELRGKVVMVRCDLRVIFKDQKIVDEQPIIVALPTIKYLHEIGAKVVLASHWNPLESHVIGIDMLLIADLLSRNLGHKVVIASGLVGEIVEEQISLLKEGSIMLLENLLLRKEETANNSDFSKRLVAKVDYFVNDAFSLSHRVLASTVGAARFTRARLAGLQFEREFLPLVQVAHAPEPPFVAIIGGGKLAEKMDVLQALVHKCDKVIITGAMALTLLSIFSRDEASLHLCKDLKEAAFNMLDVAKAHNVDLVLPTDLWCVEDSDIYQKKCVFSASSIPRGWRAIEFGPASLARVTAAINSCKMVLWIGAFGFCNRSGISEGAVILANMLGHIGSSAYVIVAGMEQSLAVRRADVTSLIGHVSHSCAALWELLKGNSLPGVDALDDVPYKLITWNKMFKSPFLPLIVDIGSVFLESLLSGVWQGFIQDQHFVAANAITSFKQLVFGYPGGVILVAIQCPNPDFNKNERRQRMVQRALVESVVEVLPQGGKIFLQSDVETVVCQMRREFECYGKGKVGLDIEHHNEKSCDDEGWLKSNPFKVATDWERHVLAKGGQMYRLMLAKMN